MKTRHPIVAKIASLLILAAGAASAQITNTYGDNGGTTGTLADIGYDSWQHAFTSGNRFGQTDPVISAASPNAFGSNWIRANFGAWNDLNDPGVGYELSSISLTIYGIDSGPPASIRTFNIYSGNGPVGTGSIVGSFDVTTSTSGQYITVDIPVSVYATGFSIGWDTNENPTRLLNIATEHHSTVAFRPEVSLTYTEVIPEPSAVLLSSLGLLPLLRRRR